MSFQEGHAVRYTATGKRVRDVKQIIYIGRAHPYPGRSDSRSFATSERTDQRYIRPWQTSLMAQDPAEALQRNPPPIRRRRQGPWLTAAAVPAQIRQNTVSAHPTLRLWNTFSSSGGDPSQTHLCTQLPVPTWATRRHPAEQAHRLRNRPK